MSDPKKPTKEKAEPGALKKITQPELDAIIEKHERFITGRGGGLRANLSYHDLTGLSFTKRNLSDAEFTGALLVDTNFMYTRLERATLFCVDMRGANLYGANLKRADLRGASMRNAKLVGANMEGVDLREGSLASASESGHLEAAHKNLTVKDKGGANLSGANLSEAKMSGAVAIDSNFSDTIMKSAKIKNANLSGADFAGANLELADFTNCEMKDINLRGAQLTGTAINLSEVSKENLEGALTERSTGLSIKDLPLPMSELLKIHQIWLDGQGKEGKQLDLSKYDLRSGFNFEGATLTMMKALDSIFFGVNLARAQLQFVDMKNADMRQTNLQEADMRGGNFSGARFNNAIFTNAQLSPLTLGGGRSFSANFSHSILRCADFTKANLAHANFTNCDLRDAHFVKTNLEGADFTGSSLENAILDDATKATLKPATKKVAS